MYPDEMDLEDSRFHWKIINPFDAMLFKYPDGDLGGQIMYDFEYYEAWLAISNATKFKKTQFEFILYFILKYDYILKILLIIIEILLIIF